jgi:hypothetical protein
MAGSRCNCRPASIRLYEKNPHLTSPWSGRGIKRSKLQRMFHVKHPLQRGCSRKRESMLGNRYSINNFSNKVDGNCEGEMGFILDVRDETRALAGDEYSSSLPESKED